MTHSPSTDPRDDYGIGIAIIGMAGRFPDAPTLEAFWENLLEGREAISHFEDQELLAAGVDPEDLRDPRYVRARSILEDIDRFDAGFFGYSARDAALMDPQLRFFLETACNALEDAGYGDPATRPRAGVFATSTTNTYATANLLPNRALVKACGRFQIQVLNQLDAMATQASYRLHLTGPSIAVQTACSSSLVALHLACQSLLNGECDIALAGAASIRVPHKEGYLYESEGIVSPDGHCRPFDAAAAGTVGGNGVGVVALKPLARALADGDAIRAVIRGTALNNDGAHKVGFTAPSLDGQAEAIAEAMAIADCPYRSIGYIESHGTGTLLGDPIEVAALTKAHRTETPDRGYCYLGSVKSNIGHLDAAAGMAGLIKAIHALERRVIPPTLHLRTPNPRIDFSSSPFIPGPPKAIDWRRSGVPRRAAVSSFGIGGTNAHVVLEEAPARGPSGPSRPWQLIPLSAKNAASLDQACQALRTHLERHPDANLADVAYTLSLGRAAHARRRVAIVQSPQGAVAALGDAQRGAVFAGACEQDRHSSIVFVFPGQGCQYVNMGRGLYHAEPAFRRQVDNCAALLQPLLERDIREIVFRSSGAAEGAAALRDPRFGGPALFTIEYALAQLWMSWGFQPSALIGHSLGEYVGACVGGVLSLQDALRLVCARGSLMARCPEGSMAVVACPEAELRALLPASLDIASVNASESFTVSGPAAEIDSFLRTLNGRRIAHKKLDTAHAYHSRAMDPIVEEFLKWTRSVSLGAPSVPIVSSSLGRLLSAEEARDPAYWARHLRETVRFYQGAQALLEDPSNVYLELGPQTFAGELIAWSQSPTRPLAVSSLPNHFMEIGLRSFSDQLKRWRKGEGSVEASEIPAAEAQAASDCEYIQKAIGALWANGIEIDWQAYFAGERRHRVPLPGYAFADERYWVDPPRADPPRGAPEAGFSIRAARADRSAELPSATGPAHPRPTLSTPYVEPRNELEAAIAECLQALLGVAPVGARDNFFELGGDSLKGVRLMSSLRERFGVNVSLDALYEKPSVEGIAQALDLLLLAEDEGQLDALLDQVEGLSDDEARAALSDP